MTDAPEKNWYTWYATFDETHSPQQRRQWYSDASRAYYWARPRYPASLIDRAIQQARLQPKSSMLEIGCGPGIATAAFAQRGFYLQAVEPSPAACKLARKHCQPYRNTVQIENCTFEDYPLSGQTFNAVLAATSFHWVTPEVACSKSAAALKPDGSLILLWATPPQPDQALCEYLQPVYDRLNLSALGEAQYRSGAYYQENFELIAQTISQSGFFEPSSVEIERHQSRYSLKKYLALLTTLSDYIALDAETRHELLDQLRRWLSRWLSAQTTDGQMLTTHWFALQVASLKP